MWLSFYFPQLIFRSENNFALVRVWPSIELKRLPGELARLQVETGCGVQWYRDFKVGLIIAEAKFLEKISRYKNYLGNISKKFLKQHSSNVFSVFFIKYVILQKALSKQRLWSLSNYWIYFSASRFCSYPYLTVFLCQQFDWLWRDQGGGWGERVCPTRFRCIHFLLAEQGDQVLQEKNKNII